jgi:hypothetical protein
MSTIRDTVVQTMRTYRLDGYISQAEPVIANLEDRERDIFRALDAVAGEMGLNPSETRRTLEAAGLTPPLAVVASGNGASLSTDEREQLTSVRHDLATLMERIDGLIG